MTLIAYKETELGFTQIEIPLNDIMAKLREYNYPEEHIYAAEHLFDLTLRDNNSSFSKNLREDEAYRDEVCQFLCSYPIPEKSYKCFLEKLYNKNCEALTRSRYFGPLFNISRRVTNDDVKKIEHFEQRRKQEPRIFGLDVLKFSAAIQDKASEVYRYFYGNPKIYRTINGHIEIIKDHILPEIAQNSYQYYYIYTPSFPVGIKNDIRKLFLKAGLGEIFLEKKGLKIVFDVEKSPAELLNFLVKFKRLVKTPEVNMILNDISRSFFYACEYPRNEEFSCYDPRLKSGQSYIDKLTSYQIKKTKEKQTTEVYSGDIPDIAGAIIAVPRLIDLENIMNYTRCSLSNLLLEEENLFIKNLKKAYHDVKEILKMATSNSMCWELQLHLKECVMFNFLEHSLYKKQDTLPGYAVEAIKQIIWGPLFQILLNAVEQYEQINKKYLAWIKKYKVDF